MLENKLKKTAYICSSHTFSTFETCRKTTIKEHEMNMLVSYLDPGLPGHVPFLHLVSGQRTSTVMLRSLPAQVDVLSGHL